MDFGYDDAQESVRALAEQIFSERSTHERLKEVEAGAGPEGPFDRRLWGQLAETGLLGIGLPEDLGGGGLDFVAECLVIEAAGRHAALVPLVETLAYGAAVLERFGTPTQRERWLPKVAAGEAVLTAALAEMVDGVILPGANPGGPATTATPRPGGWRLDGTKACVPAGLVADAVVVPASVVGDGGHPEGIGLFVVEATAGGVRRVRQDGAARPEALIELDSVEVDHDARLGADRAPADGRAMVEFLTERATAALCVLQAGVAAGAVHLTAGYTKTREQFGKPIATFQAVGQRAADAYVDAEAVHLTAWQAAWRIAEGLPAAAEVATAKYWAAEGGQRVVHAAAHLHGGVGVDRDYPLHRYFLLTHQIELTLGGARASLARLGALLAADPA